ncbi:polysaccharide deacetylase family protein [Nubsella zeaxanthinifaciens]|jgi:peptidoglycan/xylan/chitin deacetylase (PgdA/CDA1 family)|uniref:polysaccharide deacetylase family protein n=1 Tax=Nubsella zeaxanthinifaciens TaxID=392412 RepID=UPI000DE36B86|nr:polysaccharide deacetylase family protein [Nubsella zeaxanthinifaciens]
MYTVRPPFFLKWIYPKLLWNKANTEKIVYLTFDDGPIPNVTEFVLNTLKNFQIKATFFCIGDNIQKHPEIFELIKKAGHAVGNHTFNHLKGWDTNDETYIANFWKCQALTNTNLFRPPYGRIKKSQIRELAKSWQLMANDKVKPEHSQQQIVMWDVLSGDFDAGISGEQCYQNVIRNTRNGSIIVFHDSLKAWDRLEYALPKTIAFLKEKGFRFEVL